MKEKKKKNNKMVATIIATTKINLSRKEKQTTKNKTKQKHRGKRKKFVLGLGKLVTVKHILQMSKKKLIHFRFT